MKFLLTTTLALCSLLFLNVQSLQASAVDDLNEVISFSKDTRSNARNARTAAKDLAVLYFQMGDDNIDGFIATILNEMSELEESADEINFFILSAASQNQYIDPADISAWASQLEGLEDQVNTEALNLQTLIQNGQRAAARSSYNLLRSYLNQQISLSNQIRLAAIAWKEIAAAYNVRVELLYNGQVYNGNTTLGGYYAYNQNLGQYFYPDRTQDDEFSDLPGGTYTFGSFDGYFDGTNTVTVTLDPSLEGNDGYIVVQLNYWSE